jgi:hypothetical protein
MLGDDAPEDLDRAAVRRGALRVTVREADDTLVRYRLGQIEMDIQAALCTPGPLGRVKCSETTASGPTRSMSAAAPRTSVSEHLTRPSGPGVHSAAWMSISIWPRRYRTRVSSAGLLPSSRGVVAQATATSRARESSVTNCVPTDRSANLSASPPMLCSSSSGPCSTDHPSLTPPSRYLSEIRTSL